MSTLYIVATPIGNLKDISQRALEVLREVDFIFCEDTRHTKKLLFHYQISKQTASYHQHSRLHKINHILDLLKNGKNLALVSDAGTPGISDPGNLLIEKIVERFGDEVTISPIPGPNAAVTALSVSGLPSDKFIFLGYPPIKNKRKKYFEELGQAKQTVVLYESTHRILKTLAELPSDVRIVVCRELTKKFESIYRGNREEVIRQLEGDQTKGEFVVVIGKK